MIYMGQKRCNNGCVGLVPPALSYAVREGMAPESEYPYTGEVGTCKYANHTGTVYRFSNYYQVNASESAMIAALNDVGPLSVGVDANEWQLYTSGVFNLDCTTLMNHAVVIVGYDSCVINKQEVKYWIIKNSWGDVWGENGYIRLVRGQDECGVNDFVWTIVA